MCGICSPESELDNWKLQLHLEGDTSRTDFGYVKNAHSLERRIFLSWKSRPISSTCQYYLNYCLQIDSGVSLLEWEAMIPTNRKSFVRSSIGNWSFSAHDFNDEELLYAALVILQHALQMEELEPWRICDGKILFASTLCVMCLIDVR